MLNTKRPALNSSRPNRHFAETAFYMYITRLIYITFMFYQRIMVETLENSALELDSVNSHIYIYTHMTSKFDPLHFVFLPLHFQPPGNIQET